VTRPRGAVATLLPLATLAVACGGSSAGDGPDAARRVDVPGQVLALSVTPDSGPLLFSTDKGVFRVARDGGRARAIRGELVNAGPEAVRIGRQLVVAGIDGDRLLGSGHPDRRAVRPYNLGLMLSEDAGQTWTPVSLLGRSDLHLLRLRGGLLYAYDLARDRFVATTDFGRTWTESRPPGLMLDLAFDPGRPQRLVASSSEGLVRSEDAGRSWQPVAREIGLRLAWPKPDALYLIDERGVVHRSRDGGADREIVSTLGTSPEAITATGDGTLYAAGKDNTLRVSRDEGRSWQVELRLR
jgi:photosystem II stability/assembly factor-like uncharacterized protein